MSFSIAPGQIIREARTSSGVTQRSLARRAGTSQAAISRVERGLEEPTLARFEQIVAVLGWRPVIELKPLAQPDAEFRRLAEAAEVTPSERLAAGLAWTQFARRLESATGEGRG